MSELWYYKYKLAWYNECQEEMVYSSGIVAGSSYEEAMHRLIKVYGDTNIERVILEIIDDSETVYEVDAKTFSELKTEKTEKTDKLELQLKQEMLS